MPATKTPPPAKTAGSSQSPLLSLWKAYYETTTTRLKTIDAFLVFLMLSGIIQFLYCILITNFPFNAFLAGCASMPLCPASVHPFSPHSFASCVGQFVLTASLRAQVNPANRNEFKEVSPERYVVDPTHRRRVLTLRCGPQSLCGFRARLNRTTLLCIQLPRMSVCARLSYETSSCWVMEGTVVRYMDDMCNPEL